MTKETILGLARHLLTFGGGLLASKGYLDNGDVELAVGAAVTLLGIAWSAFDKRQRAA